jgi:Na+/phosphate symporter
MICLQKEEVSPLFSLVYMDMLNFYRRMKDHALNIAEVLAGEK